jgi:hypothetical protein
MADRLAAHESGLVTSIAFTEEQVCGQKFLRDFATACRTNVSAAGGQVVKLLRTAVI